MNDAMGMNDTQFIHALESCTLPESEFGHAAHLGRPDRYHETITVAFAALIQQQIFERGDGGGWPVFLLPRCL